MIPNGQVAFISDGNVWRQILSNNMVIVVTMDGISGDPATTYRNPRLSGWALPCLHKGWSLHHC
jgi:hypothetical protein